MEAYPICQKCGKKSENGAICETCAAKLHYYKADESHIPNVCIRCGANTFNRSENICDICEIILDRSMLYKCHTCGKTSTRGETFNLTRLEIIHSEERGDVCDNCQRWFCDEHCCATESNGVWFDGHGKEINVDYFLKDYVYEADGCLHLCHICRDINCFIDGLARRSHSEHPENSIEYYCHEWRKWAYDGLDPTAFSRNFIDREALRRLASKTYEL